MKNNNEKLQSVTVLELFDTLYQPKIPIVENFLYGGMYLFVGAPKTGKSFFMLQLGYHVATGEPLWGNAVHQATVLYIALEDTYTSLQNRLSCMFGVDGADNFYFAVKSQVLNSELNQQMEMFIQAHPDTKLIIIDSLEKVKLLDSYGTDYEKISMLKSFAEKYRICLLAVHHIRRMEANNNYDGISGNCGFLGVADGVFIVQKKQTGQKAIIDFTGRYQQDMRFKIKFDSKHHAWKLLKGETKTLV